jgi:hypothetical protein
MTISEVSKMTVPPVASNTETLPADLSQEEIELLALVDTPTDVALEQLDIEHISQPQKLIARNRLQQMILMELQRAYTRLQGRRPEMSYRRIAARLRIDPALVSKRMSGRANMTIDTTADMFLALEEYPAIFGVPFAEPRPTGYSQAWTSCSATIQASESGMQLKYHMINQVGGLVSDLVTSAASGRQIVQPIVPVTSGLEAERNHTRSAEPAFILKGEYA